MKIHKHEELYYNQHTYRTLLNQKPFYGFDYLDSSLSYYEDGFLVFAKSYDENFLRINFWYEGSMQTGYEFYFQKGHSDQLYLTKFIFWDLSQVIELFHIDEQGRLKNYFHIDDDDAKISKTNWLIYRENFSDPNMFDFLPFYNQQNELKEKVITHDELPTQINYLAGVEIAYNELEQKLVASISVLDAHTFKIIEETTHQQTITFPHVPDLLAFREVPPLLEAFKKLSVKPDLIICNGYGIAHPKSVGMATQLGIQTGIPTIGCATKRLIGYYQQPGQTRGDSTSLQFNNKEVGKALRTQNDAPPVFVSIGHKISLQTACDWILHLTQTDHLPQTTIAVNTLTTKQMQDRTSWDTPLSFYLKKMEEQ